MNFVFYDLETTGRSTHWDQIIQVAAIYTDSNLNILDQINEVCRLKSFCLPNPEALLVNKISINTLTNSNLSLFELAKNISKKFKKWSPAIFIGYNSILYDEEILRNTFFSNLIDPYLTIKNDNLRADLINSVRVSNYFHPEIIKSKINQQGNPILKLEDIAYVNGISNFTAHDALGDTNATIELSKLIKERLPNLWNIGFSNLKKKEIEKKILEKPFCHLETYFGRTKAYFLSFIDYHPFYKWALCFDLRKNPSEILQLDDAKFCKLLEESPKVIRNIKLNKSPFIIPIEYMKDINYALDPSLEEIFKRHNFILENKEFRTRVTKFFEERINSLEKTSSQIDLYAEETIYKNFIKRNDAETAKDFHNGSWNERLLIRNKFKDERLNYFANLIIYEEQPQLLEKDLVKKIQRTICERLLSNNNEKWLTIYNAYKIIDDLRAKDNIQNNYATLSFLDDLNKYIETVEKKLQKYTI